MARSPATGPPGWWRDGSRSVQDRRRSPPAAAADHRPRGRPVPRRRRRDPRAEHPRRDERAVRPRLRGGERGASRDRLRRRRQRCPARGDDDRQRCHVQRRSVARHARRRGGKARPDRQPGRVRTAHAGRHDRPGDHHGRTLVAGARRDRPRPGHGRAARHRDRWVGAALSTAGVRRQGSRERGARRPGPRAARRRARAAPRRSRHGHSRWSASPRRSAPRTSPPG